jgi:hypothetical protein
MRLQLGRERIVQNGRPTSALVRIAASSRTSREVRKVPISRSQRTHSITPPAAARSVSCGVGAFGGLRSRSH